MDRNDLDTLGTKEDILKSKQSELLRLQVLGVSVVTCVNIVTAMLLLVLGLNYIMSALPFVSVLFSGKWVKEKLNPISEEIRTLKQELKDGRAAQYRDEIMARISSGDIKPNPHLQ